MTINASDYPHALPDTASQPAKAPQATAGHCDELGVAFAELPHCLP
jgi:hypothetical protein